MAPNYGKKGRRRLDELQKALGRETGNVGGREATTRRELIEKQGGPLSIDPGIVAPSDQDMWGEVPQEVDCSELFPDIFIHKEIELADTYFEGPDKSTRITEYKFVSVNECTTDSTESDIQGYLYVRWESNGAVSRYGPLTAPEFKKFRDSDSLGAQCIGATQKSDKTVIKLITKGYVANADWPDD